VDLPIWARLGIGIGLAAPIAYLATPLAIQAARRFAFYDLPAGYKGHAKPTPYLGGMAVMVAFALALLIGAGDAGRSLPILGGTGALLVLGTIDDRRTVSPQLRVAVEFTLGALLAADGLGWRLGSGGVVDAIVTGIWVVAIVNAFNLFDNMDGAASTMALVVSAGACVLAIVTGYVWVAAGSAALCGACLGFLPHNLSSPAKIFLGDGGSMPLGLAVAVLVANAAQSAAPGLLALLVGFLLVGIPALDTALVIVSRVRRGVSVLTGGRDHLTHRTRMRMRSAWRVAVILGGAQALLSALVILASRAGSPALVYIVLAFVVLAVAVIVALEDAIGANTRAVDATDSGVSRAGRERVRADRVAAAILALLGLGAGLSPLLSAYYNPAIWVPVGLVLVVLAAMATIARPPRLTAPVALTLIGLAGLGLWSLLSTSWSDAVEQAIQSANLWLTYAALFLLVIGLLARRRHCFVLLGAAGLGIAVVAVTVLARLLGSAPADLFIAGRLNSPLGYINGEGCVFAMGAWLSMALAERRQPVVAGLGAAATVVTASLALLSQSRGAAIATGVAVVIAVAVIPGIRRRVLALAVVGVALAAASGPLLRIYTVGQRGAVSGVAAHRGAMAILLAAVITGLVWAGLTAVAQLAHRRGERSRDVLGRAATVACVLVVAVPLIGGILRASSIERTVRTQWHEFVHLSPSGAGGPAQTSSQTRLFSGAGNRYDYWRVGWHVFLGHPLLGVGAGNYPESYFRERHTDEAIQNPHSLELQTLAELGLPGAALLAILLAGTGLAIVRLRGPARVSPGARTVMVAGTGVTVVWLVDSSGDWMHLLPGVTAVALAAIAALCRASEPVAVPAAGAGGVSAAEAAGPRLAALLVAAAATFVLAVAGASLTRSWLVRHYLDGARSALAANPASAISQADQALALDAANLDVYYVKAAAQARFDRAAAAQRTLLQAVHQDPGSFVTWTLLGDLEVRAGHPGTAHSYYRQALIRDPREPALRAIVAAPAGRS
jgi:UDP-GlcNAc:undecaprenyl-phosphate GlcNAc-1-phosphate transferase